jgi:hypothetical protein
VWHEPHAAAGFGNTPAYNMQQQKLIDAICANYSAVALASSNETIHKLLVQEF